MRRLIRRLAKAVIVVFVIYAIAGNVFLNTPLGPWAINRKPERFEMTWSHGVTWFPGFVALWNVHAKGHVRRVVWDADTNRAYGRIAISPLFARELRIASIETGEVTASVYRSAEEMLPPPARAGGWTLRFDRIATDSLKRARVGKLDIETTGHVQFGFVKQLRGGPMEVLPSQVVLADTRIRLDDHELLREGRIESSFAIASHLREAAPGIAKLGLTDANVRISGLLPALAVDLDAAGRWHGTIADTSEAGRIDASLGLRKGVLEPGGVVDVRVPLRATRGTTSTLEVATLHAGVEADGIRLAVHLPPPPEAKGSIQANLILAGNALPPIDDMQALVARVSGTLDLDWHFDSLDWLTPLLVKAPWLALEGAGRVNAALNVEKGQLGTGSHVDVADVDLVATVAGHRFHGRARVDGRLQSAKDGPQATVKLVLARFDVVADDARDRSLMHGTDLNIDLAAAGDLHRFRESLQAQLHFKDAEVPDLRAINAYLPGDSLSVLGGSTRLGADLALDNSGRVAWGRVEVSARAAQFRLGELGMTGDVDFDARLGGSDIAARYFDLDNTTLRLRNVTVVDTGRTAGEQWWANLTLKRGRVEAKRPFNVDASADIEMQNVGLLLALFTRHRDYPGWALKLADAGTLRANGQMQIDGKTLVFDRVEASNDRFDVKARLRIAGKQPNGDLLLSWGMLALGVEVDKGRHETRLVGAKKWYEERPHLLGAR